MNSSLLKTWRARALAAVIAFTVLVAALFATQVTFGDRWLVLLMSVQTLVVIALLLRVEQQFRRVDRRDRTVVAVRREIQRDLGRVRRLQRDQGRWARTNLANASELSAEVRTRLSEVLTVTETLRRSAQLNEMSAVDLRRAQIQLRELVEGGSEAVMSALDDLGTVIRDFRAEENAFTSIAEVTLVDLRHSLDGVRGDSIGRMDAVLRELDRLKTHVSNVNAEALDRIVTPDRHDAGVASIRAAIASSAGANKVQLRQLFEQIQSTISLFEILDLKAFTPPMRGWAASPDALMVLLREFRNGSPRTALECGSGVSTLVMALAARQFSPESKIVALEHESEFAQQTEALLREHGVSEFVEVRVAPLRPVEGLPGCPLWYELEALHDVGEIDLLFVDGPPAATGPLARQPALPVLWDRLGPEAVILMDDLIRTDEQEVRDAWIVAHPELQVENIAVEKGIAILRRGSA